ncbi:MAG: CAP family protein [Micropepsaceae bacterium]
MFKMQTSTLALAAALVLFAGTAGAVAAAPKITDAAFQTEILNAHNAERRAVGSPDLKWDAALAADAQEWANNLARTGAMQHASQRGQGENLYMSGIGRMSVTQMVGGWLAERANYIPGGAHPNISKTGNWADVGHYTALVWSGTTSVGCAVGRGAKYDFLVCRYSPPGNLRGRMAYDASQPRREVAVAAAKPAPAPAPAAAAAASAPAPTPTPAAPTPAPHKVQTAAATAPAPAPAAAPAPAVVPVKVPEITAANPVPVPSPKPTVIAQQRG